MGRRMMAALALLMALPGTVRAQRWETPTFFAPRATDDVGAYVIDTKYGDVGLSGIWRQSGAVNLGVRAGFGGDSDDRVYLVGVELSGMLVQPDGDQPLAVAWLTGAGAAFDGSTALRIPAGVSVGARFPVGQVAVTPYAHPRISLDLTTFEDGNGEDETDTDVVIDLDLGGELELGESWLIRAAVTLGDRKALGFGLAHRIPRGIVVR